MLERMDEFFNNRVDGYDTHMLDDSGPAKLFYPFTAEQLPRIENASLLDLGCGTGLELEYYFQINPTAKVTCIDLAAKMLDVLQKSFLTRLSQSYRALISRSLSKKISTMAPFPWNPCTTLQGKKKLPCTEKCSML